MGQKDQWNFIFFEWWVKKHKSLYALSSWLVKEILIEMEEMVFYLFWMLFVLKREEHSNLLFHLTIQFPLSLLIESSQSPLKNLLKCGKRGKKIPRKASKAFFWVEGTKQWDSKPPHENLDFRDWKIEFPLNSLKYTMKVDGCWEMRGLRDFQAKEAPKFEELSPKWELSAFGGAIPKFTVQVVFVTQEIRKLSKYHHHHHHHQANEASIPAPKSNSKRRKMDAFLSSSPHSFNIKQNERTCQNMSFVNERFPVPKRGESRFSWKNPLSEWKRQRKWSNCPPMSVHSSKHAKGMAGGPNSFMVGCRTWQAINWVPQCITAHS